jgi:hypothetical protein
MQFSLRFSATVKAVVVMVVVSCLLPHFAAGQSETLTNEPALIPVEVPAATAAQLEAIVQLQAQQEATLKALEVTRDEIARSLSAGVSNNMAHLNAMTELLAQQRAQDMKILRDSNRLVLAIVVGLAGLLLLSILFLNFTSIRAINRLATVFQASALLPPSDGPTNASRQLLLFPGEEGQRQLGSALMQLQSRIQALEHLAGRPGARAESGTTAKPVGVTGNGEQ